MQRLGASIGGIVSIALVLGACGRVEQLARQVQAKVAGAVSEPAAEAPSPSPTPQGAVAQPAGPIPLLEPTRPSAAAPSDPAQGAMADIAKRAKKLRAYVDCRNGFSERIASSHNRYFSWVDAKKGPTGKERHIYGLYTISPTASCLEKLKEAKTLAPPMPEIEVAAEAWAQALMAIHPLLGKADDYYTRKDYQDDGMAKGKEMHQALCAAFDAFEKADKALKPLVEKVNDEVAGASLEQVEALEGRKLRFHILSLMASAKRLDRATYVKKIEDIGLAELTAKIDALDQAIVALETYHAAHPDEGKFPNDPVGFVRSTKAFLVAAKAVMRRVRDKTPYSTGEKQLLSGGGAWMVDGGLPKMARAYNDLVGDFNRLQR